MEALLTYGAAFLTTAILGFLKKYTEIADTAFGKLIKPVQPVVVFLFSYGVPWLATSVLHLVTPVDPALLASAPTATIIAVACAEILAKLQAPKV